MLFLRICAAQEPEHKGGEEGFCGLHILVACSRAGALVELARVTVTEMRDIDHADHHALDEYYKQRRKMNEEDELDALFTRYAFALSFFERWVKRGVSLEHEIGKALMGYGNEGVREQVRHAHRRCHAALYPHLV